MSKTPIKKPLPPGQHERPPEEIHQGERFRVRDKDWAKVWGENLSYEQAHKLKEKVTGRRLSTTARLEPMSEPAPDWYRAEGDADAAELEQMRATAKRAAAQAAHAANLRRTQQRPAVRLPPARTLAPIKTNTTAPKVIDIHPELDENQESVDDILDGLESLSAEDIARAIGQAEADATTDAAGGEG